jgi:deoxycytidylate deaminase
MSTRYHVKATIFNKRGHVISVGENSYWKTHPLQVELSQKHGNGEQIFLHAEIAALVRLKDWSKAHKIKVERYNRKTGEPLIAKPCPLCKAAIERAGIEIVEHT